MKKYLIIIVLAVSLNAWAQKPSPELLTPTNHTLVMIDLEGQMVFAVHNIPVEQLRNNVGLVAGASKIFNVPTIVTTVAEKSFSGPVLPEVSEFYPKTPTSYMERTSMNSWEDAAVFKAIGAKGKKAVVFSGLWTSVCIVGPVLSAISDGYKVYFITDACGDVSEEAHIMAVNRMIQAGAVPMTSLQYLLELQRDWARTETYVAVTNLAKKYAGGYGVGIQYAQDMIKH